MSFFFIAAADVVVVVVGAESFDLLADVAATGIFVVDAVLLVLFTLEAEFIAFSFSTIRCIIFGFCFSTNVDFFELYYEKTKKLFKK